MLHGVFPGMFQGFSGYVVPKSNFPALVKVEHAQKSTDRPLQTQIRTTNEYTYYINTIQI